jgi:AcrR family transcriptional regulator
MKKGTATRGRIVDKAVSLASTDGIIGLTLGRLAESVGMSKSGLFAHFRSKEELQLRILEAVINQFREEVVRPALTSPRGLPRLRALFEGWLVWSDHPRTPGGCLINQAAVELDDQPGPPRDFLEHAQREWLETLAEAARRAVAEGHLESAVDPDLLAFEIQGIVLSRHRSGRLLHDPNADALSRKAFDALLDRAGAARTRASRA